MKNLFLIFLMLPVFALAQSKTLQVAGTSPDLHLVHTTGPKESFYSIGRIYNISPKIMAPHNNLILEKGLTIGQVIKIQLNDINFSQDGLIASDEVLVPLYHKAKPKETLYNISVTHNKIPVATLKKWNNLKSDAVPNGSNMIVGYLKIKKDLSPLVANAVNVEPLEKMAATEGAATAEVKIPVTATPADVWEKKPADKKPIEQPVVKTEEVIVKKDDPAPKKEVSVPKTEDAVVKKENVSVKKTVAIPVATNKKENGAGAFKSLFETQPLSEVAPQTGLAGTFKSNSGWSDGKYYCLHNTARPGSIIKITNPANQLSVFAKVLDVIPDINQNEGMVVRLSNAASEALGVTTDSFQCSISF